MFLSFQFNKKIALTFTIIVTAAIIFYSVASFATTIKDKQSIKLPIIMYHSVLKERKYQGRYVISPSDFENDVLYLKKNGYTTIVMDDLIKYVNKKGTLPEKPVMLTFDDGYYNNYLYIYPIAKKYNIKIVISPIGFYSDQFSQNGKEANHAVYSYCTWEQINEMINSGLVEFQNHTYNLHHCGKGKRLGAGRMYNENSEKYKIMLFEDLFKMQHKMKENTGYIPTTFVYPYGKVSKDSFPVIKKIGFKGSMICESRMNYITKDPECLFGLCRFIRPNNISSTAYFSKIKVK